MPETEPTQQDPMQGFGGGASMSVPSSPLPSGPAEAPVSDRAKRAAARLAREREQSRESSPARGAEGARGAAGAPATKATRSVSGAKSTPMTTQAAARIQSNQARAKGGGVAAGSFAARAQAAAARNNK